MTRLTDKKALVMGASSPVGIGAAIARALAAAGAEVIIAARTEASLSCVAGDLGVVHHVCDITDADSVTALFDQVKERLGGLDIAVNASGMNHFSPIGDLDIDKARACIEVQFLGGLTFIRESARLMGEGGSIILLSSLTATRPAVGLAVYAGTKAGMEQVTRVAALEYAGRGIRVNGIAPGMTRTDMTEAMFANPNLEQAVKREIPLGRMGTAEDVASAALWLADPACFLTGETLAVSGGAPLQRLPTYQEIMG